MFPLILMLTLAAAPKSDAPPANLPPCPTAEEKPDVAAAEVAT